MGAIELSPLELATGTVFGRASHPVPLPPITPSTTPMAALEQAVLPAVSRPPCVVTFSGGRDSSLVLALAAKVARREGLPPPVPATIDFRGIESAEESSWQELVVRHLGLSDWIHREVTHDFDFVGPLATEVLRKHGVVWPLNVYVHHALMHHASGGSLMTGMYGDTVFRGGRWLLVNQLLAGRRRPVAKDVLRVGLAFAPRWMRRPVFRYRAREVHWLRPAARREVRRLAAFGQAEQPRRWDRRIEWLANHRYLEVSSKSMTALTQDAGALLVQPLADVRFLAALRDAGRTRGIGDRTDLMRTLFGNLLPDALLARPDKAVFAPAFRGEPSRAFARGWQGEGVDSDIVDPDVLKREWLNDAMNFRTAYLMQSAWLHVHGIA